MHDSQFCFIHNPECAEKRKLAVISGGEQTRKPSVSKEAISLKQMDDILPFLNQCINEIRRGELTSKSANAIGYLTNIAIDVIKLTDIEKRLKEVENAIKLRQRSK